VVGLSGLITPSLDEMVNVATEMQRRGLKLPLLIGGATTSRQHTAVRIAPAYDGTTVHVLDASRVAGVVSDLLTRPGSGPGRTNRAEQERLREQHEKSQRRPLLTLAAARANREQVRSATCPRRRSPGSAPSQPDLKALREMIDWQFFFLAWELKGKYPAILASRPRASSSTTRTPCSTRSSMTASSTPGGPTASGPRTPRATTSGQPGAGGQPGCRCCASRPPSRRAGPTGAWPTTSLRPATTSAVRRGHPRRRGTPAGYQADAWRRLPSIMVKALADRLAEAFAEHIHLQARRDWYEPDADPPIEELHAERFRGIRPAFGYPASPDHSLKRALFDLLDAGQLGMALTESFAMTPAASVSGLLFAHPASRYFSVGRIGQDQVADYARRRGMELAEPSAGCGPTSPTSPAVLPVVYSRVAGWHDGRVRPAAIYVGEGGAPYVQALRWPSWTVAGAQADGELHMQKPGCARPAYQCPYQSFRVKVQLSQVQTRSGMRYYARMRWIYAENHVRHVIRWMISRGFWRN
jgi:5-methyltetrahydrofolate--homocysteine methyltransferase